MRYLEMRRHSKRVRPGQHLSRWGVLLARRVGDGLGPFDRVVTSPLPRCVETAVAMGFAVDETIAALAGPEGRGESFPQAEEVDWAAGWAGMAALVRLGRPLAVFAAEQAAAWRGVVRAMPEGGRALLIGHGGAFLSGAAISLRPETDYGSWGAGAGYCEGVRVAFDGEVVAGMEALRVVPAEFGLPADDPV
jgi:broad specificity phosphatase PhoE